MDATDKKYYEDIMADFNKYRHGRNFFQFCKDEYVDYKWLLSLQRQYNYEKSHPEVKNEDNLTRNDFIELKIVDDPDENGHNPEAESIPWKIEKLLISTPEGQLVELRSDSISSVIQILTRLSECHA